MERVMLLKALRLARGNRANAARILGIARSTLFEMLKRHRVCGPRSLMKDELGNRVSVPPADFPSALPGGSWEESKVS
jgi:hypothetical protein